MFGPFKSQSRDRSARSLPGRTRKNSLKLFVLDIFTGTGNLTAHSPTPGPGGTWVAGRGTWTLNGSGGVNVTGSAGDGENAAWIDCTAANLTLNYVFNAGAGGEFRGIANVVDADHLFLCYAAGTGQIIFEKTAAGTYTSRASGTISAMTAGNSYTAKIVTNGDTISFTIQGSTIQYTVASRPGKTSTLHGIGGLITAPQIIYTSFKATSA